MTQPTKPTVPDAPLRSQPATFSARLEASLLFWTTFATYLDETGTFTKAQADAALAAATAGDLPPITGQALNYIRVKAAEDGVEFLTPAQVLTAIGAASDSDLTSGLALKAPLDNAILTGTVTAPTPTAGNNSDIVATTAFAKNVAEVSANAVAIGVGQTWQDMSASRLSDLTVYQNTTGKPIQVNIMYAGDFNQAYFEVSTDNSTWVRIYADSSDGAPVPMTGVIIPDDHYYRSDTTGGTNDPEWYELR
jgi:hypothetical protein